MNIVILLLIFFLGLFVGSFINVVIDRLPRRENFFVGRSHCDFCMHTLAWYDLFPLLSFIQLQGKCRYCGKFIGWKYPLIEFIIGVTFILSYSISQNVLLTFVLLAFIMSCLIIVFFIDLFQGIIPDSIVIVLGVLAIIRLFFQQQSFPSFLLAGIVASLFFFLIFILTKGKGMGFGDVKYAFVMGLLLGISKVVIGLYVAFLTGAAVALILVLVRKKAMKSTIAFGPFLVLGTIISIFWGTQLWILFQKILGL